MFKMLKKGSVLAALTACVFFTSQLSAAAIYFNNRAAFDAAAGALNFEGFEGTWSSSTSPVTFAGFTLSESGGTNLIHKASNWTEMSSAITEGREAAFYQDNGTSAGNIFNFSSPVTAFALDITTNFNTTMAISGSASDSISLTALTSQFWGVIDLAGLSSLVFDANTTGTSPVNASWYGVGFDAVSYGQAQVPEPAPLALLSLGLIGLLATRKMKA